MSGYRSSGQQQPSTVKAKSYIAETYLTEKDRRALFVHSRVSKANVNSLSDFFMMTKKFQAS